MDMVRNKTLNAQLNFMVNVPVMFPDCGFHTFLVMHDKRLHGKCMIQKYIRGHNLWVCPDTNPQGHNVT